MKESDVSEAVPIHQRTGHERFYTSTGLLRFDLLSFWQWSASDLVNNRLRGVLAEYIVATAVGCDRGIRVEWDAYDIKTASGIRIEVKSAAYLQSWPQDKLSKIEFGIKSAYSWDSETNSISADKVRPANVYVFCLLAHKDKTTVDPLNLDQWNFYCISTERLSSALGDQKRVALSRLLALNLKEATYGQLAATIQAEYDTISDR